MTVATEPETVDTAALEEDDIPSIPAPDPFPEPSGMTLAELFLTQYLPIEVVFTGGTRDPRTLITMRQKAADIALQLTQDIIFRQTRQETP